jgi:hypothetical protein
MFSIRGSASYTVNDRKEVDTEQYAVFQTYSLGTESLDSEAELSLTRLESF